MPQINDLWYYIGVLLLAGGFIGTLLLIVRAGNKEEKSWHKSIKRERPKWDAMYSVNSEEDLDEYERKLGGDIATVEKEQCNEYVQAEKIK